MGNTYKCTRLDPLCKHDNMDCVCSVVIGLTADDGEGNSAYIDGTYSYPMDAMPTVAEFKAGANALVSQYAADNGWVASLDSQVAAAKKRNVAPDDFEAPAITVDATVEAADGSPVKEAEERAAEEAAKAAEEEEAEEEAEEGE